MSNEIAFSERQLCGLNPAFLQLVGLPGKDNGLETYRQQNKDDFKFVSMLLRVSSKSLTLQIILISYDNNTYKSGRKIKLVTE